MRDILTYNPRLTLPRTRVFLSDHHHDCLLTHLSHRRGQIASFQFMRLPSKRQYPDYYVQIKRPIALDDIKAKLEAREYTSLNEVLQDFETCFRNAKRYNMKESQIWKDAKFLHVRGRSQMTRFASLTVPPRN